MLTVKDIWKIFLGLVGKFSRTRDQSWASQWKFARISVGIWGLIEPVCAFERTELFKASRIGQWKYWELEEALRPLNSWGLCQVDRKQVSLPGRSDGFHSQYLVLCQIERAQAM